MMTNKQMIENKHNKVHCPQNTPVPPVLTPCTTRLLGWRHLQSHSLIYLISTSELYTLLNAILMAPKSLSKQEHIQSKSILTQHWIDLIIKWITLKNLYTGRINLPPDTLHFQIGNPMPTTLLSVSQHGLQAHSRPLWLVGKKPLQGSQDFTLPDTNSHLIPQNVKTQGVDLNDEGIGKPKAPHHGEEHTRVVAGGFWRVLATTKPMSMGCIPLGSGS